MFLILITLLTGCNPKEPDFPLSGKWVLLSMDYNEREVREELIHTELLRFTIRDERFLPAIQFDASDSTVIVPRLTKGKEELLFSVDKDLTSLKFFRKEVSAGTEASTDNLFLRTFSIEKDEKLGRLTLISDSVTILMLPAPRFSRQIQASELD